MVGYMDVHVPENKGEMINRAKELTHELMARYNRGLLTWEINGNQPVPKSPKTEAGARILPILTPLLDILATVPKYKRKNRYRLCEKRDGTWISCTSFRQA